MEGVYVVIDSERLLVKAAFKFRADAEEDAHERELKTGVKHIVWRKDK